MIPHRWKQRPIPGAEGLIVDDPDGGSVGLFPSVFLGPGEHETGLDGLAGPETAAIFPSVFLGPGDHETLGMNGFTSDWPGIEEKLFFDSFTDAANYAALPSEPVLAARATGLLGPIQAPSFPETITVGAVTLTPTGGGNRTSGNDDYNATIGTLSLLVAEIVDAINDPLNSFAAFVTAVDLDPYVGIVAKTPGVAGNSIVLTSSDTGELYGPWPTTTQGIDFNEGGGGSDLITLTDGSTWTGLGFPAGPQTIVIANAENGAKYNGTYGVSASGVNLFPGNVWAFPSHLDDNTATITRLGLIPAPGFLSGGVDAAVSALSHGEYYRVTGGSAAGSWWQYARWINSTTKGTPLGMFLPSSYFGRVTDYIRDASGNPYRISVGLGGDKRATILTRGFAENNIGGTVADVSGTIELNSNIGFVVGPDGVTGFDFVDGGGGNDILRRQDGGDWAADGMVVGSTVTVANATDVANNGTYTALVVGAQDLEIATGSVTAGTGDQTATFNGNNKSGLVFIPAANLADQRILLVGEVDVVQLGDSAIKSPWKARFVFYSGEQERRPPLSLTAQGTANRAACTHVDGTTITSANLTYGTTTNYDTITRSVGSWLTDGFLNGFGRNQGVHIRNAQNAANDGRHVVYGTSATILYVEKGTLTADTGDNSAILELMPGRGQPDVSSFARFFADLAVGYDYAGGVGAEKNGHHRLWLASDGIATREDHDCGHLFTGGLATNARSLGIYAEHHSAGSTPTRLQIRELHGFVLEG
jgi:hypothetical protein